MWPAREKWGLPYEAKIMWERRVEESSRRADMCVVLRDKQRITQTPEERHLKMGACDSMDLAHSVSMWMVRHRPLQPPQLTSKRALHGVYHLYSLGKGMVRCLLPCSASCDGLRRPKAGGDRMSQLRHHCRHEDPWGCRQALRSRTSRALSVT